MDSLVLIYLHVAEADIVYLMDIYGKDEQEDLTFSQKKMLKNQDPGTPYLFLPARLE